MQAVIVTYHFLQPQRPCERLLEAHQAYLDTLAGVEASIVLDSRSERAYLLTYESQAAIDAYFGSDEFRRMSTQPGCNDVFVKEFDVLPSADESPVPDIQPEEVDLLVSGQPVHASDGVIE